MDDGQDGVRACFAKRMRTAEFETRMPCISLPSQGCSPVHTLAKGVILFQVNYRGLSDVVLGRAVTLDHDAEPVFTQIVDDRVSIFGVLEIED